MHPRQRSPRCFYAPEYRHRGGGDGGFGVGVGFGRGYNNRRAAVGGVAGGGSGGGGGDIFVEAGRLAAEYLVSQGLLPPNVLSLKWHNQNGSFKKHLGVGVGDISVEGGGGGRDRSSALTRLGNSGLDGGGVSERRKLGFEEFGQKGRRRGSFNRSNGLDWSGREYRRNGSWSDRFRGGPEIRDDGDDDGGSGSSNSVRQQDEELHQYQQEQPTEQVGGNSSVDNNVMEKSNLNECAPISKDGDDLDAGTNKDWASGGELLDLKEISPGAGKESSPGAGKESSPGAGKDACDMDVEFVKSDNDLENISAGVKELEDGADTGDSDEPIVLTNLSDHSSDEEDISSGKDFPDLLSLCNSVKVPTKTRSSLTHKNLKGLPLENNGDGNIHDVGELQGSEILVENESVKGSSSGDLLSDKTCDLVNLDPDTAEVEPEPVHAAEDLKELDDGCKAEEVESIASQSGQDRDYMHDKSQESTAALPECGSGGSMSEERGEKRAAEDDDIREDTKRLREWVPVPLRNPKTEVYFLPNNPIEVKENPGEDEISHIDKVGMTSDQDNLMSSSQFTEDGDRPFFQCPEEKPSLPSSFRTCDLNLIEASEVHDNHVDHPALIYPIPVPETKKVVPVGIDLSMNHASVSGKFSTHTTSGKEIEVIDLEDDSIEEEKAIDSMNRKTETMFPGLEGFSNPAQNPADIHDAQDGYGLMISELLGTDFTNCSSVPGDMNSVHNEMGLDNETGTLAEDDSIYMSLGELSFLRPWEQPPPQDYQKHF